MKNHLATENTERTEMKLSEELKFQLAICAGVPFESRNEISADGKTCKTVLTTLVPCDVVYDAGQFKVITGPIEITEKQIRKEKIFG